MMVASSDGHATLHVEASSTRRELVLPFVRPQKAARFSSRSPRTVKFFSITFLLLLIVRGAEQNEKRVNF